MALEQYLPYLTLALASVVLAFTAQWVGMQLGPRKLRFTPLSPFEWALIIVLVTFAGSRIGIGTDYQLYAEQWFPRLDTIDWSESIAHSPMESGFTVLGLVLKSFGFSPQAFIFFLSAITIIVAYGAIHYSAHLTAWPIAIYILFSTYLAPMNTVRQGLAESFILLALVLFPRHRFGSLVLLITAASFHISALIAGGIMLLALWVKSRPLTILVMTTIPIFIGFLLSTFPQALQLLGRLNPRYLGYIEEGNVSGFGTYLVGGLQVVIALIFSKAEGLSKFEDWLRSIYSFAGPITLLGTVLPVSARLGEYFALVFIVLAPSLIRRTSHQGFWWAALATLGTIYFLLYLSKYGGLLPYRSWIFQ